MTYIMIDPASLEATAAVFRTATEVLSELGPQVARACDGVLAPPGVAANVGLDLSTAALALQTMALELLQEAGELTRRAACCCQGEASSLPVPALVGLAFGARASLAPQQLIQLSGSSAVSAVAAFGPGVVEPSFVSGSAASGPGVFAPAAVVAPAPAATLAPAPVSLHQALANASFGSSSPMGSGISMVYNPSLTAISPALGVQMVPDLTHPSLSHTTMPRIPLHGGGMSSIMTNFALEPLNSATFANIHNATRATVPNSFMS